MSRVVTTTDNISVNTTSYDTTDCSYKSHSTVTPGFGGSSSSGYDQFSLVNGQNAETYVYFIFDSLASIPANATNITVTCSCKCYISTTTASRITTRTVQLYSGSSSKGTAKTFSNSSTAFTVSAGTWTRAELQNAKIKMYVQRGSSNTTNNYYTRFYGATLTVNYSYDAVFYTVTATSNSGSISVSPSSQEYSAGDNATISITGDVTNAQITDNNTDVKSSLSGSSPNYTYTIPSIAADHTFVIYVEGSGPTIFYKQNGSWVQAESVFYKQNGV